MNFIYSSGLSYCILGVAESLLEDFKKKKRKGRCRGPKLKGYCPFLVSSRDLTRGLRPGGARKAGQAWVTTKVISVVTRIKWPQVATWEIASRSG